MKVARIVLVAEWNGWCGACTAERPLVLTRTGRRSLRAWLSASSAPDEQLRLTCRLCGVGDVVPPEDDDPEVVLGEEVVHPPVGALQGPDAATTPSAATVEAPTARRQGPWGEPTAGAVEAPTHVGADVHAARCAVGRSLHALLAQRTALESAPSTRVDVPAVALLPPALPSQRTSVESTGLSGFEALQLLAEGIDLVSHPRP